MIYKDLCADDAGSISGTLIIIVMLVRIGVGLSIAKGKDSGVFAHVLALYKVVQFLYAYACLKEVMPRVVQI